MKLKEFLSETSDALKLFELNMQEHCYGDEMSFADWFDIFRAWSEVGTDEETNFHGERTRVG